MILGNRHVHTEDTTQHIISLKATSLKGMLYKYTMSEVVK